MTTATAKHTPGPWFIRQGGRAREPHDVRTEAGALIASVTWDELLMDDPEAESHANARLIVAGPRMLMFLRALDNVMLPNALDAERRAILRDIDGE